MPHRTTYFFPRQFPDRSGFDVGSSSSSKSQEQQQQQHSLFHNHEKTNEFLLRDKFTSTTEREHATSLKTGVLMDRITSNKDDDGGGGDKYAWQKKKKEEQKQQLSVLYDWMAAEKRQGNAHGGSGGGHVRLERPPLEEDRQLLLREEPEAVMVVDADNNNNNNNNNNNVIDEDRGRVDVVRSFDRQLSVTRLCSGSSSYAGSWFSGTTTGTVLDGSFQIKEETTTATNTTTVTTDTSPLSLLSQDMNFAAQPLREEEVRRGSSVQWSMAERTKESYYLQLALAKRLSLQSGLAPELVLFTGGLEHDTSDAETVSYRLWASGCLSYGDKISDGFYNILGMNPQLWVMCNDDEEGRRMPSIMSLKEIEPSESSMEVVLIDKRGDSRLKELENKAHELYCASENMLVLVEKLGKLVAIYLG